MIEEEYLAHYGILKQKWGLRRYQYSDGTLTPEGYERYHGDKKNKKNKDKPTLEEQIKTGSKIKARILAKPRPVDVIKYQDLFDNKELEQLNNRFKYIYEIQKNAPEKKKSLINRLMEKVGDVAITNLSSAFGKGSRIFLDKMIASTMDVPLKDVQSYGQNKGDKNKGDKNKGDNVDDKNKGDKNKGDNADDKNKGDKNKGDNVDDKNKNKDSDK